MERKLLTAEIAVAYFKANIITGGGIKGALAGVETDRVHFVNGKGYSWEFIHDTQLILTPLSEITDEHGKAIAKILSDESDEDLYDEDTFAEWMEEIFSGNCCTSADYVSGDQFRRLIAYCQRNSIDVGYDEIPSLIEAKIARKKV